MNSDLRHESTAPNTPPHRFGDVLTVKHPPRVYAVSGGLVGLVFLPVGMPMSLLGAALAMGGLWMLLQRYEIRERGVVSTGLFGRRELAFRDVKTFSVSLVTRGMETTTGLTFWPHEGRQMTVRVVRNFANNTDPELMALRDRVSVEFAARMAATLKTRRRVPWVDRLPTAIPAQPLLSLTSDAVVIGEGRDEKIMPFSALTTQVAGGHFSLRTRDGARLYTCACSRPNFYPGLLLMEKLMSGEPLPGPDTPGS